MEISDVKENYSSGWIKIYRSIKYHWIWKNDKYFKIWCDFLMRANHKENKVLFDANLITIKRGEFITSQLKLAEDYSTSRNRIRRFLELLENDLMIEQNITNKFTKIIICNYETYQDGQPAEGTTESPQKDNRGTQTRMNKNGKNEEEIEKLTVLFNSALYIPKLLENEFIQEIYEKFGYEKSKTIIRKFAGGNFRKVDTMREALNPDGTIKPKQNEYKKEGKTVVYNPPK